jgi:hypothetical protein
MASSEVFACLNSGPGKTGDPCTPVINTPPCGDGLVCFATQGTSSGTCLEYCDPTNPSHACPTGQTCNTGAFATNVSEEFFFCSGGSTLPADSGAPTETGSPTPESGTDGSNMEAGGD